jgi:hypothetical protein
MNCDGDEYEECLNETPTLLLYAGGQEGVSHALNRPLLVSAGGLQLAASAKFRPLAHWFNPGYRPMV